MVPTKIVLWALQRLGEVKVSPGENGCMGIKLEQAAQSHGVLHTGHEHAEQTASFLASTAACRTAHVSAHPGPSLVLQQFYLLFGLSPKRSMFMFAHPLCKYFSLGMQRVKGKWQTLEKSGLPGELPGTPTSQ